MTRDELVARMPKTCGRPVRNVGKSVIEDAAGVTVVTAQSLCMREPGHDGECLDARVREVPRALRRPPTAEG